MAQSFFWGKSLSCRLKYRVLRYRQKIMRLPLKTLFAVAAFILAAKSVPAQPVDNSFNDVMARALERQSPSFRWIVTQDTPVHGIDDPSFSFEASRPESRNNKTGRLESEHLRGQASGRIQYIFVDGYLGPLPFTYDVKAKTDDITAAINLAVERPEKTPVSGLDPQWLVKSDAILAELKQRTRDASWQIHYPLGRNSDGARCVGEGGVRFAQAGYIEGEWFNYLLTARGWQADHRAPYFIVEIGPDGAIDANRENELSAKRPAVLGRARELQAAVQYTLRKSRRGPVPEP